MQTTCGPNVHVTMDTPLLAVGVISDTVGQMGCVPSRGRAMPQRGNFYRVVASLYAKCPCHLAKVGADWGQITSE